MTRIIGLALTKLTSKFGLLTRRASKRLATETGEKILVQKNKLGRNLNAEEIESVFAEVIPKKCRPKLITKQEEVKECLRKTGLNEEQITEQLEKAKEIFAVAANVFDGKGYKLWIPAQEESLLLPILQNYVDKMAPANIAHEMEHSLELSCRVINILKTKMVRIQKFFGQMFNKNYMEKINTRDIGVHNYEGKMQYALADRMNGYNAKNKIKSQLQFPCEPTAEGISKMFAETGGDTFENTLRTVMREECASGLNMGKDINKRLKALKLLCNREQPAYEVTGKIEREIFGLSDNEYAVNTALAKCYETSKKLAKQERRTYWKNRILGRLKKPNIYTADKDILRYASTKEEKAILKSIMKGMNNDQKSQFVKVLYQNQDQKTNILEFIKAIQKDNPAPVTIDFEAMREGVDFSKLSNPDIIKIVKIHENYIWALPGFTHATSERLKDFAKIAGEKRYSGLAECLDSPHYEKLKSFADVKTADCRFPYSDKIYELSRFSAEKIDEFYIKAQEAAKKGEDIVKDIEEALNK